MHTGTKVFISGVVIAGGMAGIALGSGSAPEPESGEGMLLWGAALFVLGLLTAFLVFRAGRASRSEAGLRAVFNSIADAVLSTDREGRVVMMNSAAEMLTGWNGAEAKGRPAGEVFRLASGVSPVEDALRSGGNAVSQPHAELLDRQGGRRYVTGSASPLRDAAGKISGCTLLFRDTAPEREAVMREDALRTELQDLLAQYELVLDIMPVYVYAEDADDDFRHVFCNRICADLWGRPIEEALGKNDAELFGDSEEIRRFQETDAAVMRNGDLHESIQAFTGSDGKRHMGRFFRKGIELSGGRRWMFGLAVDITEEYAQKERLNAALHIFEYASDLTRSAYFTFNPETREMTGAKHLDELWPTRDGKALSNEEVVYGEDLELFSRPGWELLSGQREHATVDYRSTYFGEMRYYRLKVGKAQDACGAPLVIGVIQDVSEITRNTLKLQETLALQDIIVNSIPMLLYAKNANDGFKYVLANRALAEVAGSSAGELIGKTDAELAQPMSRRIADEEIMNLPGGVESEEKILGPDGFKHVFRFLRKPFSGLHGERLLLGVASDVTELSELNASRETVNFCLSGLLAGEEMFDPGPILEAIGKRLNASGCFLLRFDLENRIAYPEGEWQETADAETSFAQAPMPFREEDVWFRFAMNGEPIFAPDVDDPETIERFGLWPETNRRIKAKSLYFMVVYVDGKPWGNFGVIYRRQHTLSEYETAFFKSAGPLIGLMQQRKNDRTRILAALEQARNADKAKSYFLASMSHEIRTPLNAVIGFAELLVDEELPPDEQKEYLRSIATAGETLLALINDVLDLSKLEAGQMVFAPSEADFAELAAEVGGIFRQKCAEKNLRFATAFENMPAAVWLDKLRMRQILFNLLGNAVKFTDSGEIRVEAFFARDSEAAGTLTFAVVDTGIGISEDDQKRLFQMFVQSSALQGTQAAGNGTGLGLAIVRRMVEHMNGDIALESTLGEGSKFIVKIRDVPFRDAAAGVAAAVDAVAAEPEIPRGASVLLVDDVPLNLKVLSAMLRKIGIEPVCAGDAAEALALLENALFDYLLTDFWMPGMNGAELAARLRANQRYADMTIAVVTADAERKDGFDPGLFDAVITKPITVGKLKEFLRRGKG